MKKEIDLLQVPAVDRSKLAPRSDYYRAIARRFDREFFDGPRESGYGGYRDDGRWQAVALRLMLHYGLRRGARVLDIGCAKGFLVREFRKLGLDAIGIDVSAYAISQSVAPRHTLRMDARDILGWHRAMGFSSYPEFELVVAVNTLHNLERVELGEVLKALGKISRWQYITLDAWRNDEERQRMEAWNLTARTMMSTADWLEFFAASGYRGDYSWFMP